MRLHEVHRNPIRSVNQLAQTVIRVWEKERSNEFAMAWLVQLSSDERLLARLYKGSQRFEVFGGDGNESFLDSAADCACAFSILSKIVESG